VAILVADLCHTSGIKAIKWMWNDTIDDIRWWRENGKIIDGRYLTNSELRQQD